MKPKTFIYAIAVLAISLLLPQFSHTQDYGISGTW